MNILSVSFVLIVESDWILYSFFITILAKILLNLVDVPSGVFPSLFCRWNSRAKRQCHKSRLDADDRPTHTREIFFSLNWATRPYLGLLSRLAIIFQIGRRWQWRRENNDNISSSSLKRPQRVLLLFGGRNEMEMK